MEQAELEKQLKEMQEQVKTLIASKQRVEEESKSYKERARKAEQLIEDAKKQKLEQEGKLNEVLQKEREEKQQLLSELTNTRKKVLSEKLRSEVAKVAKDALDVDLVLRVNEHADLLQLDSENLSVSGVEEFVAKVKESKPFLFGKKKLPDGDNKLPPNGKESVKTDEEKYFEELEKVKTQKELDDLRRKYGK